MRRAGAGLLETVRSRGFIVFVIVFLTVLYAVGLVVPQRRSTPAAAWEAWRARRPHLVRFLEVSGAADVYRAPTTLTALGFFFLSLGAVIVERLPRQLRRTRLDHGLPLDARTLGRRAGTRRVRVRDPEEGVRRAAAVLANAGYEVFAPTPGAARAVRFRRAPLGFVLFHGAFVLLLAGGVLIDLTRFSGDAYVAEGEVFDARRSAFVGKARQPRLGEARPDVAFTVLDVRPLSEAGFPLALHVALLLRGEALPRVANINEPILLGSTSLLVSSAGATPLFACEGGGAADGAWVKLVPDAEGRTRFVLEACGLDVLARVNLPGGSDAPAGGGVMLGTVGSAGLERAGEEGIEVAIRGPEGAIARGVLHPGSELATPDGSRRLWMPALRYYARIQVVDEHGGGLLWGGFVVGLLGLALRLALFRREVALAVDPAAGEVLIASAADAEGWGPEPLVERIAAAIRGEPSGGRPRA